MARTRDDMGDGVDAGAVRHGRGIHNRVPRLDGVHVDKIAHAHGQQVAVAQHHALGLAGGPAGVEQPGQVCGSALCHGRGWPGEEVFVGGSGDVHSAAGRLQPGAHVGCDEGPAGLGVVNDPLRLAQVQLRIHRHHHQAGPPGTVKHFQVSRVVVHEQRNTFARCQAGGGEGRGQAGRPVGQAAVVAHLPAACEQGGALRVGQGNAPQGEGEVHGRSRRRQPVRVRCGKSRSGIFCKAARIGRAAGGGHSVETPHGMPHGVTLRLAHGVPGTYACPP